MKTKLEQLFADWTVKQEPVPAFPEVTAKPAPGTYFVTKTDVNQAFIRLGHLGGMLKDEDYPALSVMSDILGGGFASRLFKKIRTELGYAYGIGSSWGANYGHPGIFQITGSTKSASATETIQETLKEIARIQSGEVTDEELATAKDAVMNSFVFYFDSPGKTLSRIVRYAYFDYPEDFIFKYQKAVENVTKADVMRVAKQYMKPDDFTVVAVGNPAEFGAPLTALNNPVTEIDITIPEPKQEVAVTDDASLAKGKQILGKVQQAVGGADALAAVTDYSQVAKVIMQTPQGAMNVDQTNRIILPSTFRQEMVAPFGQMTSYYGGNGGWLKTPQGPQPMPPPVIKQVQSALMRSPFRLWLADRQDGWTVNAVSDTVIEITDSEGMTVQLEIAPDTGLPVKLRYQSIQMTGTPSKLEDTFADWREVNGVKVPYQTTVTREGAPYAEVTVQEYDINGGLSPEALAQQ
jgi:zinc protease